METNTNKIPKKVYEKELRRLHIELAKWQRWVVETGKKVVVIFEGRDAAGKGSTIKRITERLNPRFCKVVALHVPTEKEESQWYFQRYVEHLPSAGQIVLFDRSWYNRAGVERVMGFCSDTEYWEFMRSVSVLEEMLQRSGIILIKYWFSVNQEVQKKRFMDRIEDPTKRWKISKMDLEARRKWHEYSAARDIMFMHTDTEASPWYIVDSNRKRNARINCINHLLQQFDYTGIETKEIELPPLDEDITGEKIFVRPQRHVPDFAWELLNKTSASED